MVGHLDEGNVFAQKQLSIPGLVSGSFLQALLKDELITLFKQNIDDIVSFRLASTPQLTDPFQSNNISISTTFTRSMVERNRVKSIDEFVSPSHFLRWVAAHSFRDSSAVIQLENGSNFKIRIDHNE